MNKNKFDIALCQLLSGEDKDKNIKNAERLVRKAVKDGAHVVALPEIWNSPYDNACFRDYSEPEGGKTYSFLFGLAKDLGIYLIGGSIPESEDDKVYNTSYSFDREGRLIGKHRKMHMFDIDIEGGIRFMESEALTPGDSVTVLETEYCKIGIAICFDVRFPELSRKMALEGAEIIVLPAAFNMTTGPAHWELSMRARALDNQVYFAAVSPARNINASYIAWGHSCVVSPWGDVLGILAEKEGILSVTVDTEYVKSVRDQLPLLKARRPELY